MRLRRRDQQTVNFFPRVSGKQDDGTTYTEWSETLIPISGSLQPAGGKVMSEIYGQRLTYMLTLYISAGEPVEEGMGACIYTDIPDYKVVAVRRWQDHWIVDLEKCN